MPENNPSGSNQPADDVSSWPHEPPPSPPVEPSPADPTGPRAGSYLEPRVEVGPPPSMPPPSAPPPLEPPPLPTGPAQAAGRGSPDQPVRWQAGQRRWPAGAASGSDASGSDALTGAALVMIAGVALVVGAFLPWIAGYGVKASGWETTNDARFLFAVGIAVMAAGAAMVGGVVNGALRFVVLVAGVASIAVGVADAVDARHATEVVSPHPGAGVWLAIAAGALLLASLRLLPARAKP